MAVHASYFLAWVRDPLNCIYFSLTSALSKRLLECMLEIDDSKSAYERVVADDVTDFFSMMV